jgi:hypothetical protein
VLKEMVDKVEQQIAQAKSRLEGAQEAPAMLHGRLEAR